MLTTPHSVVGATIAVLAPFSFIALPLVFFSHFILDSIPHWQETLYPYNPSRATWIRVPMDVALSVVLISMIARVHPAQAILIWSSACVGNLPDFDSILTLKPGFSRGMAKLYWDFHCRIQRETSSLWGLMPQVLVVFGGLWITILHT